MKIVVGMMVRVEGEGGEECLLRVVLRMVVEVGDEGDDVGSYEGIDHGGGEGGQTKVRTDIHDCRVAFATENIHKKIE